MKLRRAIELSGVTEVIKERENLNILNKKNVHLDRGIYIWPHIFHLVFNYKFGYYIYDPCKITLKVFSDE